MRNRVHKSISLLLGVILFACSSTQQGSIPINPTSTSQKTLSSPQQSIVTTEVSTPTKIVINIQPTHPALAASDMKSGVVQWLPIQIPRARHTATLLPNGKILLAGGSLEPNDFVADEELINPMTGASSFTAPLQTLRHGHTATLLPDGRVLVIGGYSFGQWLSDAEVYDPSADTWTLISPLHSHGIAHTATRMKDGRVLVVGGCIGSGVCTENVEIFDPKTNFWIDAQPLKSDRASHTAQLLFDGRVLIAGGTGAAGGSPTDGEGSIYDPQTNTWTPTSPMLMPRHSAESVLLPSGQVLVVGGFLLEDSSNQTMTTIVEIYDPASNKWEPAGELTETRFAFILITLQNGQVLAIGGARVWDGWWDENSFVHEIELYDPAKNQWLVIADNPQPRAFATGILLPDGRVWVAGGQYGQSGATFPPETWLINP